MTRTKHVDTPLPITEANLLVALEGKQLSLHAICLALGHMFVNRGQKLWTTREQALYSEVSRALQLLQAVGKVEYKRGAGRGWART